MRVAEPKLRHWLVLMMVLILVLVSVLVEGAESGQERPQGAWCHGKEIVRLAEVQRELRSPYLSTVLAAARAIDVRHCQLPAHAGELLFHQGLGLWRAGQLHDARTAFAASLKHHATEAVRENLAGVLAELGDLQPASELFAQLAAARCSHVKSAGSPARTALQSCLRYLEEAGTLAFRAGYAASGRRFFWRALHLAFEPTWVHSLPAPDLFGLRAHLYYQLGRAEELNTDCPPSMASHCVHDALSNLSAAGQWAKRGLPLAVNAPSLSSPPVCHPVSRLGTGQANWSHQLSEEAVVLANEMMPPSLYSHVKPLVQREVTVCRWSDVALWGNDGIVGQHSPESGWRLVPPSLGAQTALHRQASPALQVPPSIPYHPTLISGVQTFAVGYYHFLLDVLPRILIAVEWYPGRPLLLPTAHGQRKRFMVELLALVGLADYPWVPYDMRSISHGAFWGSGDARLQVQQLVRVEWQAVQTDRPGYEGDQASWDDYMLHYPPSSVLQYLRQRLQPRLFVDEDCASACLHVLLVLRRTAVTRRISNEQQLLIALSAEVKQTQQQDLRLHMDIMGDDPVPNVRDIMHKFRRADVVIGVHGAGLANAIVMRPGTLVVEWRLTQPHASYYEHLAASLGLRYIGLPFGNHTAYAAPASPVDIERILSVLRTEVAAH